MLNAPSPTTATLATPISIENPVGHDPREDLSEQSLYQRIKTLRARCRERERHAVDINSHAELINDWKLISEWATTLLREQAKDLEVTAWLIEGLTRVHGFAGLNQGFEAAQALIETFWPHLYPLADEEGVQTTLAALTGLNGERNNGTLITPIHCIPLLEYNTLSLASWHYHQAKNGAPATEENAENEEHNDNAETITLKTFQEAAIATGWKKISDLRADIELCIATYEKLCALLIEKCGNHDSPPSSTIRNTLNEVRDIICALQQFAPPPEENLSTQHHPSLSDNINHLITDRENAFHELKKIADYFRQHEPNSPVPFLLEQAIRWGNMSLPELLSELVYDEQALSHSYKLIGAKSVSN